MIDRDLFEEFEDMQTTLGVLLKNQEILVQQHNNIRKDMEVIRQRILLIQRVIEENINREIT